MLKHDDSVDDVSFNPRGDRFVTGCRDKKAHVWSAVAPYEKIASLECGSNVEKCLWSADGIFV